MTPDATRSLKRNIFQRLLGKCVTREPIERDSWRYSDGKLEVDLSKIPELSDPGSAVRLEGDELPERLLLVHGDDGEYRLFRNRCTHGGRRLDPVPGASTVQCCSIGKSTFDYSGKLLAGSAKDDLVVYPVQIEGKKLVAGGLE
jgi:nitrite reductase/ring-hydroxylating ferredoxin subunit